MIDIVLTIVIALLIGYVAYLEREHRLEKAKLLNAILSRRPEDMVNMTLADQTTVQVPKVEADDSLKDLVDINDASDEEFYKHIGVPHGQS